MRSLVENEVLNIFLEGELNSSNAEKVEQEIDEILSKGGFNAIRIDCENLRYISSAGLRIIVRIKQKYDDTRLTKVPESVYSVLVMVGFQNLLTIERI